MWHLSTGNWKRDESGAVTKPEVMCGKDYDWQRMRPNHLGSGMPNVFIGKEPVTRPDFVTPAVEKHICPDCLEAGLEELPF